MLRKRLKRFALILVVLAAVLGLVPLMMSFRAKIVGARFKNELLAKGERLEIADLAPKYSPADATNGAQLIQLMEEIHDSYGWSNRYPNPSLQLCIVPGKARVVHPQEEWCDSDGTNNWVTLNDWLSDSVPTLEEIDALLQERESFDFGYEYSPYHFRSDLQHLAKIKAAGLSFSASALIALHEKDRSTALREIRAIRHLSDALQAEREKVSQLVRIAVVNIGIAATWEALQAPGWTDEELSQLQTNWQAISFSTDMLRTVEMHRILVLATLHKLREGDPVVIDQYFPPPVHLETAFDRKAVWDRVDEFLRREIFAPALGEIFSEESEYHLLIHTQPEIEELRLVVSDRSAVRLDEARQIVEQKKAMTKSFFFFRYYFTWLVLYDENEKALLRAMRAETLCQLAVADIALRRYQNRYSHVASSLKDLVPEFLPDVPHDFMNGKPLGYRPNEAGGWILYSVGENLEDDGGKPDPKTKETGRGWYMWSGLDAVWPQPASAEEVSQFYIEQAILRTNYPYFATPPRKISVSSTN